jgi:hypothetical protein
MKFTKIATAMALVFAASSANALTIDTGTDTASDTDSITNVLFDASFTNVSIQVDQFDVAAVALAEGVTVGEINLLSATLDIEVSYNGNTADSLGWQGFLGFGTGGNVTGTGPGGSFFTANFTVTGAGALPDLSSAIVDSLGTVAPTSILVDAGTTPVFADLGGGSDDSLGNDVMALAVGTGTLDFLASASGVRNTSLPTGVFDGVGAQGNVEVSVNYAYEVNLTPPPPTSVPVPAPLALIGLGILGMAGARRALKK